MAIKRYQSNADNTITNAFKSNLETRGTNANMGASDVLETFSIYGQASSGSTELTRILLNFPITNVSQDRAAGLIPGAGDVEFYLKMYNARHSQTIPLDLELNVFAVSRSWQEGTGLDMDEYKDTVKQGDIGSTWISASSTEAWSRPGGDYHVSPSYSQKFDKGTENLNINVTSLVEEWLAGTKQNYGFGIHISSSQEAYYSGSAGQDSPDGQLNNLSGSRTSYYTKKFFGRNSEFYFSRPVLEARWNSTFKDDRGNFYASSSLLPAEENLRSLFLYNELNGRMFDLPGAPAGTASVRIYTTADGTEQVGSDIEATRVSKGVYQATFALDTTASVLYDRWFNQLFTECYHTGTFSIKEHNVSNHNPYPTYVTNLTNLRPIYYPHERTRFRFYVREKDWCPTIYTVATKENDTLIIESASFQVHRVIDDLVIVPFSSGTDMSTQMSYDVSGNYFDLDMGLLQPGYSYGIKLSYFNETVQSYVEQPYEWKFRVEELDER
jgi:hypothetical protein